MTDRHLYFVLHGAVATVPGMSPPDVHSYVITGLSVPDLVALSRELADAVARGDDAEVVLERWDM